ncbi:MAG TPA: GAF domain-containing protein [Fimbriimonadaceae bacterium]|jgi:two-component sensor histidine kinase
MSVATVPATSKEVVPGNLEAIFQLLQHATSAASEDALLSELAFEMREMTQSETCDILLKDASDGLVLKASTIAPEFANRVRLGRGIGLCGKVFLDLKPLFLRKGTEEVKEFVRYPGIDDHHFDSSAIVPICLDGKALGVLMLRRLEPWDFKKAERENIMRLVDTVALAYSSYHRAYEVGTRSNRLGALSEVSKTISASPYLEEILQLLVNLTAQQFNYRICTVRLLDESQNELVLRATQAPARAYERKRAIRYGESIAGKAMVENRPIIVVDVQNEADYIGHDLAVEQGLRSMICVPLTLQDKPVGVLSCYTTEVREFSPDEIKALETLAKQAAVSIEHAKLSVRSTLMQEMHHRVKNNLQQIASLLRLQLRHSHYKSLEEAINDCLARILAIATVHDLLSREDLDHVGLRSIAETLVQHQQHSLIHPDKHINFEVRGEDVRLNMTQATQVALVLNELIQNAVEHGFHETDEGDIHVTVEEREAEVSLWVSNNGDQLPPKFDPASQCNLGLQIVDNLSRALGGKFKIGDILGWTVAEVKFGRSGGE